MSVNIQRETKQPPESVVARVNRAGGYNILGQPSYRVIWSWNRLAHLTAYWEDVGRVETRLIPKYPIKNRWLLEKWVPPEYYGTPELWVEKSTETEHGFTYLMDEYPSKGDYEHSFTIESGDGEFLPLSSSVVTTIIRCIEFSRRFVNENKADAKEAIQRREAKKEKGWSDQADQVMDHFLDMPFDGRPHIVMPNLAESLRFSKLNRGANQ